VSLYRGVHLYVIRETLTALAYLEIYDQFFNDVAGLKSENK
jgi:hypothetical protein